MREAIAQYIKRHIQVWGTPAQQKAQDRLYGQEQTHLYKEENINEQH